MPLTVHGASSNGAPGAVSSAVAWAMLIDIGRSHAMEPPENEGIDLAGEPPNASPSAPELQAHTRGSHRSQGGDVNFNDQPISKFAVGVLLAAACSGCGGASATAPTAAPPPAADPTGGAEAANAAALAQFTPAVAAGKEHSCGLDGQGNVECWGGNTFGQAKALGH